VYAARAPHSGGFTRLPRKPVGRVRRRSAVRCGSTSAGGTAIGVEFDLADDDPRAFA
jgi:hypothetical protein